MDNELLSKIKADYPELKIIKGRKFAFRPPKTIVVGPLEAASSLLILHELGHAVLRHKDFGVDVERLKMEMQAWEKARELAKIYEVEFDEEVMQEELSTYRDWLHRKSRCPICGLTRYQKPDGQYCCPKCSLDYAS